MNTSVTCEICNKSFEGELKCNCYEKEFKEMLDRQADCTIMNNFTVHENENFYLIQEFCLYDRPFIWTKTLIRGSKNNRIHYELTHEEYSE